MGRRRTSSVKRRWSDVIAQKLEIRWNSLNSFVRSCSQGKLNLTYRWNIKAYTYFSRAAKWTTDIWLGEYCLHLSSRILTENPDAFPALSDTVGALYLKVPNSFFPKNPLIGRGFQSPTVVNSRNTWVLNQSKLFLYIYSKKRLKETCQFLN